MEFPFGERSVRRLGLGVTGPAGPRESGPDGWGPPADRAAAVAVLRAAVDAGVNLIDANSGAGHELIREALHPYPDDLLLLATVGRRSAGGPGEWRAEVLAALRSLGAERLAGVDVWLPDPADDLDDLEGRLDAVSALRDEGLIAEIGLADVTPDALDHAAQRTEITWVRGAFTVLDRSSESLLWSCARQGIAFIPHSSAFSPVLAHPPVLAAAGRLGVTAAQVVLAWYLTFAPNVLLTLGAGSPDRLREALAAGDVELDRAAIADLDTP